MTRNDTGATLMETLVVMVVVGMMLGGVLSTLYASVKLVQSAPTDTNPHAFGALATAVARLEGEITPALSCENPQDVNSRKDCLRVKSEDQTPTVKDGNVCWVVTTDDGRRLECWELLDHGDLVAHQYAPKPPNDLTAETCDDGLAEDCLGLMWQDTIEATLPKASGLTQFGWDTDSTPVKVTSCAAIRPDQRATLDEIPLCDGTEVSRFNPPDPLPSAEGQRMPTLRVFS